MKKKDLEDIEFKIVIFPFDGYDLFWSQGSEKSELMLSFDTADTPEQDYKDAVHAAACWKRFAQGLTEEISVMIDLVALAGYNMPIDNAVQLQEEQIKRTIKWAGKVHLKASDNNVRVPQRPHWIKKEWEIRLGGKSLWPVSTI